MLADAAAAVVEDSTASPAAVEESVLLPQPDAASSATSVAATRVDFQLPSMRNNLARQRNVFQGLTAYVPSGTEASRPEVALRC